jgi:hypothetical protein
MMTHSQLRILYVGPDAIREPEIPNYLPNPERAIELIRERPSAFGAFLGKYFEAVEVVAAQNYGASMSEGFAVTIFDAQPEPVASKEKDGFVRRLRLPEDFDKPALMVGEVGPRMLGRSGLGLKLDHL